MPFARAKGGTRYPSQVGGNLSGQDQAISGGKELGKAYGLALQFRHTPKLLGVDACDDTRRFAHYTVQDLFLDGPEELVAVDLPRMNAQRTRASCDSSYRVFLKCPAQSNALGFSLTARLVLSAHDSGRGAEGRVLRVEGEVLLESKRFCMHNVVSVGAAPEAGPSRRGV